MSWRPLKFSLFTKSFFIFILGGAVSLPLVAMACGTEAKSDAVASPNSRADSNFALFQDWAINQKKFAADLEPSKSETIARLAGNDEYKKFAAWATNLPKEADKATYVEKILAMSISDGDKKQVFVEHIATFEALPYPEWPIASEMLAANQAMLKPWITKLKALEEKITPNRAELEGKLKKSLAFVLFGMEMALKLKDSNRIFDLSILVKKVATLPISIAEMEFVLYISLTPIAPSTPVNLAAPLSEEAIAERKEQLTTQFGELERNATSRTTLLSIESTLDSLFSSQGYQNFVIWAQSVWNEKRQDQAPFIDKLARAPILDRDKKYILAFYIENRNKTTVAWPAINPVRW